MSARIEVGDCRDLLRRFAAEGLRAQVCVTSPPYWLLRDYGVAGQVGLEPTIEQYVAELVSVFRLVRDVLAADGVLWLNLGDTYAGTFGGQQGKNGQRATKERPRTPAIEKGGSGLKPKDLVGVPWRVAFALQADGWWLRQDVIWSKPNPMPESVADRCTKAHEYVFLLSKSERYFFDGAAIQEPATGRDPGNLSQQVLPGQRAGANANITSGLHRVGPRVTRQRRSVWSIAPQAYREAHFATLPVELARLCVLSGSRPGQVVLDPFLGSGSVALAALELNRVAVGCELNPDYARLAERRLARVQPLLTPAPPPRAG